MRNPTPGAENAPHHGGHGPSPSPDLLGQMGYETRDISLIALVRWLLVFFVFIAGSTGISYLVFRYTVLVPLANEPRGPVAQMRYLPPFPQVQANPRNDMMDYRTAEDQVLSGKGSGSMRPGLSIDDAINAEANQHGISGIKGDATPWNYSAQAPTLPDAADKSYPGGGDYGDAAAMASPKPNVDTGSSPAQAAPVNGTETAVPTGAAPDVPAASPPAPIGNGTTP